MSGWGDIAGGVLSGGFGLLGGFLSNEYQKGLLERQQAFQRELSQNAIKWRVKDAQEAGIHPLYALGANTPSSFPISLQDNVGPALGEMGQHIGGAITRMLDSQAKEKHQLEMALGAASLAESDARKEMYLSEAARNRQQPAAPMPGLGVMKEGGVRKGTVTGTAEVLPDGQDPQVPGTGLIDVGAMQQTSAKEGYPDVVAGLHPGWQEFQYRGMPVYAPQTQGESLEEIFSEMSLPAFIGMLQINQNLYGKDWFWDFVRLRYNGEPPRQSYTPLAEQNPDHRLHPTSLSHDMLAAARSEWKKFQSYGQDRFKKFMRSLP